MPSPSSSLCYSHSLYLVSTASFFFVPSLSILPSLFVSGQAQASSIPFPPRQLWEVSSQTLLSYPIPGGEKNAHASSPAPGESIRRLSYRSRRRSSPCLPLIFKRGTSPRLVSRFKMGIIPCHPLDPEGGHRALRRRRQRINASIFGVIKCYAAEITSVGFFALREILECMVISWPHVCLSTASILHCSPHSGQRLSANIPSRPFDLIDLRVVGKQLRTVLLPRRRDYGNPQPRPR